MNQIDWKEYERRKRILKETYPTPQEYDKGLRQIVADLEREADEIAEPVRLAH